MKMDTEGPYALHENTGVVDVWWLGGKMSLKATGADTEGRFAQLLATDPRGTAAPLHLHEEASETFYVVDGEVTLFVGDDEIDLGPGEFALVPPGVTHSYLVRSGEARFFATIVPAGTEGFFTELGTPVVPGEAQPAFVPPDPEEFARRAASYGIQVVGPPPTLG
ncbi:MAG TPA: quercetin 2,3-dioxygenase [Actinomycetota bacterium]|nr:quercetin 2,3-dioxygenase [Actinomycetota bacterium]